MLKQIEVKTFEEVQTKIASIRNLRLGFITNFYPEEFRVNLWIKNKQLVILEQDEIVLFLVKKGGFSAISFCSTGLNPLKNALMQLSKGIYTLDWVSREDDQEMCVLLNKCGFSKHSALFRMRRLIDPNDSISETKIEAVRPALESDIPQILSYFDSFFDPYIEQIPTREEIMRWIDMNGLLVSACDGKVVGFVVFDSSPSTWYLRYWFVAPQYRDLHVGSALLKAGIEYGKLARRQMLWVIETNQNAIMRYEHYGFIKEAMKDTIYIYKNN